MRKLKKYKLDFNKTIAHMNGHLNDINTLSDKLLKSLDFNSGLFFTLLLPDSNIERIYEFESGLILPQNKEIQCWAGESASTYSIIPTIQEEIAHFLFEKINENQKLTCIFDDVLRSPNSPSLEFFAKDYIKIYKQEIYYELQNAQATEKNILKFMETSNAIWHSLCLLTTANFENIKDISLEQIDNVCSCTQLIALGAYDGEGFIFWEKLR